MNIPERIARTSSPMQIRIAVHLTGMLGVVIICVAAYVCLISETKRQLTDLNASIQADSAVVARGDQIISSLENAECEFFAMNARLDELTNLIPNRPEESLFLAQLAELAESSNLSISDFRPGRPTDSENLKRIKVELSGAGSYRCLCDFLNGLQALPRLTHVSDLSIEPADEDGRHPVSMGLAIFYAQPKATKVARNED